jgi:hypothetical protein
MKRRRALQALTAAGSLAVAGCASVPGLGPSGTVLGRIAVVNHSLVPARIRLWVERDDEQLLERDLELTAIDAGSAGAWRVIDPVWAATPGRYTVRAHHVGADGDRESGSREYTFTREDYEMYYGDDHADPGCVAAHVTVGQFTDDRNATIAIGPTDADRPCAAPAD